MVRHARRPADDRHRSFALDKLAPPVHITDVIGDDNLLGIPANLRLAPLTRSIRIDYKGLSFVTPQKLQFKDGLSRIDRDWQDVGTRREAFYMNLPPDSYTFSSDSQQQ